jgi:hypothetical protein
LPAGRTEAVLEHHARVRAAVALGRLDPVVLGKRQGRRLFHEHPGAGLETADYQVHVGRRWRANVHEVGVLGLEHLLRGG